MALPDIGNISQGSGMDALISGAATALLQRTYMLQTKTPNGVPILLCVFDIVTSEVPTYVADVSQHPVESGLEVADHIQLKNPSLKIVGTISNTPLDLATTVGNLISGVQGLVTSASFRENALNSGMQQAAGIAGAAMLGGGNKAAILSKIKGAAGPAAADTVARSALISAWQNKSIFDVVTKRIRYKDMAISSLSFPRDSSTGLSVIFEIEMQQVRIVSTGTVNLSDVAENVTKTAVPSQPLGSQSTLGVSAQATAAVNASPMKAAFK